MKKMELNSISVELSPCSKDYDEISLHTKVCINNKVFQRYQFIPVNDIESVFDTVWNIAREELKKLILEEMK